MFESVLKEIKEYNRITIGTMEEMKTFVSTVADIIKEECK